MKFISFILLSAISTSSTSSSFAEEWFTQQDLEQAVQLRNQASGSPTGYNIVESLTTEVGPRLAGSDADKVAVEWAKKQFSTLGFDKVWSEEVKFPSWQRIHETGQILSPFPQPVRLTALGNSVSTPAEGLTGEVVHFNDLDELQNADADQVKGKIAFISKRMGVYKDGKDYGATVGARVNGASIAASKGAIAVMIRSVGTDNNRTPHTGVLHYDAQSAKIPAVALSNPDADLVIRQLNRGLPVSMKLNVETKVNPEAVSYNVIGEISGSTKPNEIILLGAHLDSWDLGTGAIDDGAGVGIVMAAAHYIGQLEKAPKRTIRVVLFANEESGLFGGKAYKKAHLKQLDQHIIGAESDFGAGRIYQLDANVKADAWPAIEKISGVLSPLDISLGENHGDGGPDLSPFQHIGMATFDLKQDGTHYFDWHHTSNDTLDKISPNDLAQNVAAYTVIAYLSAQMEGDFGKSAPEEEKQK
ncbi:MAG: peptidase M28 family protein [Gammaproteobacteria bacterium CG22_combo_CG10-13_8_21_14_all_40_8]|nr:MAG: peptidase M28 family protein [Gammaproteobacteria bacterium CG22_combo_CG10-13_8_21_14_all_40_8]